MKPVCACPFVFYSADVRTRVPLVREYQRASIAPRVHTLHRYNVTSAGPPLIDLGRRVLEVHSISAIDTAIFFFFSKATDIESLIRQFVFTGVTEYRLKVSLSLSRACTGSAHPAEHFGDIYRSCIYYILFRTHSRARELMERHKNLDTSRSTFRRSSTTFLFAFVV